MADKAASDAMSAPAPGAPAAKPQIAPDVSGSTMSKLVLELVGPYRGLLVIVFAAMLIETAASLSAPWPLKVVIDNVLGNHKLPDWLAWVGDLGQGKMGLAAIAAGAVLAIALVEALASYVDNYYTESVGQWVANDLRMYVYDHLELLFLCADGRLFLLSR